MSAAINELDRLEFVELIGAVQGASGRKASKYRVGSGAGFVLAVDAGSTHVRLRVASLDRRLLHSRVYRLPASQQKLSEDISLAVADEVKAALDQRQPDWGPLRTVGIALPARVVGPKGDVAATGQEQIFSHFTPPDGVEVLLENNVNCAAVAEQVHGCAKGFSTFAYLQIGVKIGLGLVLGNQLIRGWNGAAGEIGHLSFPFAPGLDPIPGEVERYLGTEALMRRVQSDWPQSAGPLPEEPSELLGLAEQGRANAVEHVRRHASDIGALVATCVSVVDPGLVVLGGGFGSSPQLLPYVSDVANKLAYPVEIKASPLAADATVLGIEMLAIDRTMSKLLDL